MENDALTIHTASPEETELLGRALFDAVPDGIVVALHGDLGAGKTCFVRGMTSAIMRPDAVSSPTFTLAHEHRDKRTLYHLDLYRIHDPREVIDIGGEEMLGDPEAVCAIEWAERAEALLPAQRVQVDIGYLGEHDRRITLRNLGVLQSNWKEALAQAFEVAKNPPPDDPDA